MAELIASSVNAGASADFTLTDGASATIFLKDAVGTKVCPEAIANVQIKSGTEYFDIGTLDVYKPVPVLQAPGTFRVYKYSAPLAFGVDKE